MIVAQVGEPGDIESKSVDSKLRQCLRRYFDCDRADFLFAHAGDQRMHFGRLWSGEARHNDFAGNVPLCRRGETGHFSELAKDRLENICGRGFTVGSGCAKNSRHQLIQIAVNPSGQLSQSLSGFFEKCHRHLDNL